jgi:hypothetical protein
MISLQLSSQAQLDIGRIASKNSIRKIAKQIDVLSTFPRLGIIDSTVPADPHGMECRVTYASSFGIRYHFDSLTSAVLIDTITDERSVSPRRFL